MEPVDAALFADTVGIGASVVVRDAAGHLHRFEGGTGTLGGSPHVLDVPLGDREAQPDASFAYPLELLAIEIVLTLPEERQADRGDRRR